MSAVVALSYRLLCDLLEGSNETLAGALLESDDEREALQHLLEIDAIDDGAGKASTILCPSCGLHEVAVTRPRAGGLQALCPECGSVTVSDDQVDVVRAKPAWVTRRIAQALKLDTRNLPQPVVDGLCWKIGDWARAGKGARKVIFARRLGEVDIAEHVRRTLDSIAPRDQAILITSTPRERSQLAWPDEGYVHLPFAFNLRGSGLVLDEALFDWCLKPAHLRERATGGAFHSGYRGAYVGGREFTFSDTQAQFFENLDIAGGRRHKQDIMANINTRQEEPRELFRKNPDQLEGFNLLIDSDGKGFFWLR